MRSSIPAFIALINDQDMLGLQFINILPCDEIAEFLNIVLINFQSLPDIKYQVALTLRDFTVNEDQFDNFYDKNLLLLHGEGLIHLFGDLHDLRPVVNELLSLYIDIFGCVSRFFCLIAAGKLIK